MKRRTAPAAWGSAAVTALLALGLAGLSAPVAATAAATTYHVATTGADSSPGTAAQPFKTIQKCATVAAAGDTCLIGAGTYRETVKPARSGTAGNPITFAAAPGAVVTVDGTDAVSGWTVDSGKVYKASVTLAGTPSAPYSSTENPANDDLWANQVFSGGAMVPEAAYPAPSSDPFAQTYLRGGVSTTRSSGGDCVKPPCTQTINGTLTYNNFPAFGDMTGVQAYFTGGWVALSATVTGGTLTATNKTLNLNWVKSDDNVYPGGGNARNVRFVGSKAFLTGPGQWYYDPAARQLFMWASDGNAPTAVTAKKRNYSFDLNSRAFVNVKGIRTFSNTVTTDDSSHDITLDGLTSSYLSHWQTAQYSKDLPYAGAYEANHRYDSGILLHGSRNSVKNSTLVYSSGNGVNLRGGGHAVTNNYIHDVSYNGTYTAAVTLEVGTHDAAITRNSLYNTGRDVINMSTNLFPNDGYKNLDISYNDISGFAKVSFDLGGIYVCCDTSLQGSRIHHNRIHDPANPGNGMHFDNGTYDMTVDHNVLYNLKGSGDLSHGGNGIAFGGHTNGRPAGSNLPYLKGSFFNNTIVSGRNYTIFNYFADAGHVANSIVRNNILDGAAPAGQDYGYIAGGVPQKSNNLVTKLSANGTGTDPRYVSPTTGRFEVGAASPAIDAGVVVPGITDGFSGAQPDVGAFEGAPWTAGCSLPGCPTLQPAPAPVTPTGVFTFVANHSGKALSVDPTTALAEQKTLTSSTDQRWKVTSAAAGASTITNVASGKCLEVSGGSSADLAPLAVATCTDSASQRFTLQNAGAGFWRLASVSSGKCADVPEALKRDDVTIVQYTCTTATNQQWELRPVS